VATKTISMSLQESDLALIDEFSGGNRTAFMVAAATDRARALRRAAIDEDIARCIADNDEAELVEELDGLIADGLEDDALVISV